MADEEGEELVFKGARPKCVTIFQRMVAPPALAIQANPWLLICTMPSDVHHWRMYGILAATGAAGPPVKIAFIDEPAPDEWIPLIGAEPFVRYEAPKAIYAQSITAPAGAATLVVVEVWTTKMPARVKDREKSKLGTVGRRQG